MAGPSENVLVRVRQALPTLRPSERALAEAVLADPAGVAEQTITGLAARSGLSSATVTRFSRTLGFDGYTTFRIALARAAEGERVRFGVSEGDIDPADGPADVVSKLAHAEARAVEETAEQLDLDQLTRVVQAIQRAPAVDVYGVAGSGLAAQDLQQKLLRIGVRASAWTDTHLALTSAAVLPAGAVAVGFSHSGETLELVAALRTARERGAFAVAVTNFPDAPLGQAADAVLTTVSRETRYRYGAMSSRMAQLIIVDAVFLGVAQQHPDDVTAALTATMDAVGHRYARPERQPKGPES